MGAGHSPVVLREIPRCADARHNRVGVEDTPLGGHRAPVEGRAQPGLDCQMIVHPPLVLQKQRGSLPRTFDNAAVPELDLERYAPLILIGLAAWKAAHRDAVAPLEFGSELEIVAA